MKGIRFIRVIFFAAVLVLLLLFLFKIGENAIFFSLFSAAFVKVVVGKWLKKRE